MGLHQWLVHRVPVLLDPDSVHKVTRADVGFTGKYRLESTDSSNVGFFIENVLVVSTMSCTIVLQRTRCMMRYRYKEPNCFSRVFDRQSSHF